MADIRADQWPAPAPCTELDVHAVLNHLVRGNLPFARLSAASRGRFPARTTSAAIRWRPTSGPQHSCARRSPDLACWSRSMRPRSGPGPGAVLVHVRIVELLVHSWDLARATGQSAEFPHDVAGRALARSRQRLTTRPQGPRRSFCRRGAGPAGRASRAPPGRVSRPARVTPDYSAYPAPRSRHADHPDLQRLQSTRWIREPWPSAAAGGRVEGGADPAVVGGVEGEGGGDDLVDAVEDGRRRSRAR